ncbi:MAG TPA: zinc ribbon domain-containing protein [Lachnospiraceae bacterium]|nr:zinc ribbon domain-containing protein [Lachnospiraceae bacterium]
MKYLPLIIILLLVLTILFTIYYWISKIRNKIRNFTRQLWGTDSITEGAAKMKAEYSATPKSISAMTSLCLPKIVKDFPDFQYNEMKDRSNNLLISYLLAITAKQVSALKEGNAELKNKLVNYITMLEEKELTEHFERIKIHRTEISGYRKEKGRCIITFQSSIEYFHYIQDVNGIVAEGEKECKFQSKYNVDLIYIQDRSIVENELDLALGVNCPNCGAPLSSLGAKICEYCSTPIIEINIHAWSFSDVYEINRVGG